MIQPNRLLYLLKILCGLSAFHAITAGGFYLLFGVEGLAMTGSVFEMESGSRDWVTVDFFLRAIAGIWLVFGAMLAFITPSLERHTAWFRFCCAAILFMGIGRMVSLINFGACTNPIFAMYAEFVVPIVLLSLHWVALRSEKVQ